MRNRQQVAKPSASPSLSLKNVHMGEGCLLLATSIQEEAARLGIVVNDEQAALMERFWQLLMEENRRINLTRIIDPREAVVKHFLDSLTVLLLPETPAEGTVVDVGSGAGFPGIPLAIVRPRLHVVLVESVGKKARFLQRVSDELRLNTRVVAERAETLGRTPDGRERYDAAVARALAPLPVACEWCLPLVRRGGIFVAMRGASGAVDVEEAQRAIEVLGGTVVRRLELVLPDGAGHRVLVVVRKVHPTPPAYPRPGGEARRRPL